MTAPADTVAVQPNSGGLGSVLSKLAVRWALIAVATVVAFYQSLLSLVETTRAGSLNSFVWTMPLLAVVASYGISRRRRAELPIHDRETDVIFGIMGLILALVLDAVLMQRYALFFDMLRLDLLAMWMFVISATILLFGMRPMLRFAPVWMLMLLAFPLPYHVLVLLLGGGKDVAGLVMVGYAGIAAAIGFRQWLWGGAVAVGLGLAALGVMNVWFVDAPVWMFQQIPAVVGLLAVAGWTAWDVWRADPTIPLQRRVKPLAERQVLTGVLPVVIVSLLLALVPLPEPPGPPTAVVDGVELGGPLVPPQGWHVTETTRYDKTQRLYGARGVLIEQRMLADVGDPRWDKSSAPRMILAASVTASDPFSFRMYPAVLLFELSSLRASPSEPVDLGSGVTGELTAFVDDRLLITWTVLRWTWRNDTTAQRVLLIAVDDHRPEAPFPQVGHGISTTLNSLITIFFRGNAAMENRRGALKDAELLTEFGKGVIAAQPTTEGSQP